LAVPNGRNRMALDRNLGQPSFTRGALRRQIDGILYIKMLSINIYVT
jgi:hypothetical protein